MELITKREAVHSNFNNLQPGHEIEQERVFLEEEFKGKAERPFVKDISTDKRESATNQQDSEQMAPRAF